MTESMPNTSSAAAAALAYPKTVTLPSGIQVVQVRPLKGRDAVAAQRVAEGATDMEKSAALVSQVVTREGRPMVMEDILELDLSDVVELLEVITGKFKPSTPASSSPSAASAGGPTTK